MQRATRFLATIIAASLAGPLLAAEPFTLTSTSFSDGDRLAREAAGNIATNPNCVGTNASPQLAWSNLPEGTKSLALLMVDPEGRSGLGVTHWVAYGIPVTRTAFAAGEIAQPPAGFVGGKSTLGLNYYMGPCTPPGTSDHHYTFIAIATDLEPGALPADLTREELLPRLAGHAKASSGLVGRFRHPSS
jgi:Raf kinase inhibitor-like YbhB/YbcL family protein